jgi:hypothetical protein
MTDMPKTYSKRKLSSNCSVEELFKRKSALCSTCFKHGRSTCEPIELKGEQPDAKVPCQFCHLQKIDDCRPLTRRDVLQQRVERRRKRKEAELAALERDDEVIDEVDKPAEPVQKERQEVKKKAKPRRPKTGIPRLVSVDEAKALLVRADQYRAPCTRCRKERKQEAGVSDCIGSPCKWCTDGGHECNRKPLGDGQARRWVAALAKFPAEYKGLPRRKRCVECNATRGPQPQLCQERPEGSPCYRCVKNGLVCIPDTVVEKGQSLPKGVVCSGAILGKQHRDRMKKKRKRSQKVREAMEVSADALLKAAKSREPETESEDEWPSGRPKRKKRRLTLASASA